uniref:Uncharacterized protein n=1 Tax=Magnetospirillum gryphiswaldense TaxID=55518 RepID=A4U4Y3_9PROT|nr:hypothetical protein MGR_4008 [Magnetospirillum gryphiswaldense MSR-1]
MSPRSGIRVYPRCRWRLITKDGFTKGEKTNPAGRRRRGLSKR